jgi:hypothetical protein
MDGRLAKILRKMGKIMSEINWGKWIVRFLKVWAVLGAILTLRIVFA